MPFFYIRKKKSVTRYFESLLLSPRHRPQFFCMMEQKALRFWQSEVLQRAKRKAGWILCQASKQRKNPWRNQSCQAGEEEEEEEEKALWPYLPFPVLLGGAGEGPRAPPGAALTCELPAATGDGWQRAGGVAVFGALRSRWVWFEKPGSRLSRSFSLVPSSCTSAGWDLL